MRRLRWPIVFALVVISSLSPTLGCEHWECSITEELGSQCWVRLGPDAIGFPYAVRCTAMADCPPGGGSCGYWCRIDNYCFDV